MIKVEPVQVLDRHVLFSFRFFALELVKNSAGGSQLTDCITRFWKINKTNNNIETPTGFQ